MLQWLIKALLLVTAMTTADGIRSFQSPPHISPYLPDSYGYYGINVAYGPSPYAVAPAVYGHPYMSPYSGTTLFADGQKQ